MNGNTGGVNLHIRGVGHVGTLAVALDSGRAVAAHGVGAEEVGIAVTAGGDDHGIGGEALQLASNEVLGDDTACAAVDNHHVLHLIAGVEFHLSGLHLCGERGVGTEQELLSGLSLCIEGTRHLCATERAVGEHAAVLTCEGHTLCHTLVDDIVRHLGQAVHVGLTGTVVATLHGVVEQAVHGVAVVLVVLGGVDTALRCDGVSAAGRVLDAEVDHVEPHLTKAGSCAGAGQTRTHYDDIELELVLRVHQALVSFIIGPFLGHGAFRNS